MERLFQPGLRHADIQGSELTVFPQAGHLPMEEQAAAFNARLIEFLRQ